MAEIPRLPLGVEPLPEGFSETYLTQLSDVEAGILGRTYIEARRIRRIGIGRINLGELPGGAGPEHAEVFLLTHLSGTAVWEVWATAPMQSFDASLWIHWLDPRSDNTFAVRLWNVLRPLNEATGGGAHSTRVISLCHEGGLTLLASRSGLDLHGNEDIRDVENISALYSHGRWARLWPPAF